LSLDTYQGLIWKYNWKGWFVLAAIAIAIAIAILDGSLYLLVEILTLC